MKNDNFNVIQQKTPKPISKIVITTNSNTNTKQIAVSESSKPQSIIFITAEQFEEKRTSNKKNKKKEKPRKNKKKVAIKNLIKTTKKELKISVLKRMNSFKNEKLQTMMHENEIITIENIVRYLHSLIKFAIESDVEKEFSVEFFSVRSSKSINNTEIFKIYVDVAKNTSTNKIGKKNKIGKTIVEQFCGLQFLNKSNKKIKDFTNAEKIMKRRVRFHYIDNMNFRINENSIGGCSEMKNEKTRNKKTKKTTKRHFIGKIQIHTVYKKQCRIYYKERLKGKFFMMQETLNTKNINGFKNDISAEKLKKLIDSKNMSHIHDFRSLIESEVFLKHRNNPQNFDTSDTSKKKLETNAKNEKKNPK